MDNYLRRMQRVMMNRIVIAIIQNSGIVASQISKCNKVKEYILISKMKLEISIYYFNSLPISFFIQSLILSYFSFHCVCVKESLFLPFMFLP